MSNSFFFPSMIKLVINLKDKDNTIHGCVKNNKMFWTQVKKSLNLLYMYNFIEMKTGIGIKSYNLTEDGKKLRDCLCTAHFLINKNKKQLEVEMYGYKTRKELIEDVSKDLEYIKAINFTTTTST